MAQVASGRFGVTPQFLANADQLEIKIAQGAKPGTPLLQTHHTCVMSALRLTCTDKFVPALLCLIITHRSVCADNDALKGSMLTVSSGTCHLSATSGCKECRTELM